MRAISRRMIIWLMVLSITGCSEGKEGNAESIETDLVLVAESITESQDEGVVPDMSTEAAGVSTVEDGVTTVSWKVVDYGGDYFHLFVNIDGDMDYYAGYFFGENFDTYEREDTPDYALTSCGSFWTGSGNMFYLYQKNDTELAVMHHPYPYKSEPEDWEEYQEILIIPVAAGNEIKISDPILTDNIYSWAREYPFIIYDSLVLGAVKQNSELVPLSDDTLNEYYMVSGEWGYRLFRDGEYQDTVSHPGFSDEWLRDTEPKTIELEYQDKVFDGLAINTIRPIRFGERISIDTFIPMYQEYIAQLLSDNELQGEAVHIDGIFQMDLEGDGIDEVLIMASNIHAENNVKGQYSIVVLRKIIDGKVESLFLIKDIKPELPTDGSDSLHYDYKLCEIVDLNRDGVCELLIKRSFYEGYSYVVYELINGKFEIVMQNGFEV